MLLSLATKAYPRQLFDYQLDLCLFQSIVKQLIFFTMPKPIVLHLGDSIKYNHDFYKNEFLSRFDVINNDASKREEFVEALRSERSAFKIKDV